MNYSNNKSGGSGPNLMPPNVLTTARSLNMSGPMHQAQRPKSQNSISFQEEFRSPGGLHSSQKLATTPQSHKMAAQRNIGNSASHKAFQ